MPFVDRLQHGGQLTRIGDVFFARVVGHAAHPVQVGAGAKGGAHRCQHHGAHVISHAHRFKRGPEFLDHLVVEGVAHLGTAERDASDAVLHRDGQGLGHGLLLSAASCCRW